MADLNELEANLKQLIAERNRIDEQILQHRQMDRQRATDGSSMVTYMGVEEHGRPYEDAITFMAAKEHGQPYETSWTRMIAKEHGQPYVTTNMAVREHGQPYRITTVTKMGIRPHGQPYKTSSSAKSFTEYFWGQSKSKTPK